MLTLISHFYNEEFLMPYFVRHHLEMFDKVVMIDHESTDNSVDIIRTLAPEWEIKKTALKDFSAPECDAEVMQVEVALDEKYPGCWKLALNTTEHVFMEDFRDYMRASEEGDREDDSPESLAYGLASVVMVDDPAHRFDKIRPDKPLWRQKNFGFEDIASEFRPLRYIHRKPCGMYGIGRHSIPYPYAMDYNAPILWWGFSPMEYVKARKLQIQSRIPRVDRQMGWSRQHIQTEESLEAWYQDLVKQSYDLLNPAKSKLSQEPAETALALSQDSDEVFPSGIISDTVKFSTYPGVYRSRYREYLLKEIIPDGRNEEGTGTKVIKVHSAQSSYRSEESDS